MDIEIRTNGNINETDDEDDEIRSVNDRILNQSRLQLPRNREISRARVALHDRNQKPENA